MSNLSTESTPRERLARFLTIVKRARLYWRSATIIAGVGVLIAFVVALNTKRAWRSETTLLYRDAIQTDRDQASQSVRAARLAPKLKDMLYARPKLQQVIEEFGLYPEQRRKSMLHAIEEFSTNVSFKARDSSAFVISFIHEDPKVAQEVTAKLAEMTIADYNRENMSTAVLTRDFMKRELEEADKKVVAASRALATFLAENPQFQWGGTDSPYAPQVIGMPGAPGQPGVAGVIAMPAPVARPAAPRPGVPYDAKLAALERQLAQVEAALAPPPPVPAAALPPHVAEAQRSRDAAAAEVAKAEGELAEKLRRMTPAHPDVIGAKTRVAAAKSALTGAESALRSAKASVPSSDAPKLSAERRAELEKDRAALRRQIADRRARPSPKKSAGDEKDEKAGDEEKAEALAPVPDTVELETTWHRLKLDLERARETFKALEAKAQSANIAAEAVERQQNSEMVVLDPAYLPTRAERGRGKTFFAGATIAIFLALAMAGSRVLMNDTLYDPGDVAALNGPAHLVSVPHVPALETATPAKPPRRVARSAPSRAPERPERADRVSRPSLAVIGDRGVERAPKSRSNGAHGPASRPRRNAATLPYGSVLPVAPSSAHATAMLGTPLAPPVVEGALARVEPTPESARSLSLYALSEWMETSFEEPEVEVVGTDLDLQNEGGQSLLRGSPPAVLAALRVLRHRLEQRRGDGHLVVAVTSPEEGDGKTTLALRLAMTLAESERARVVLVEGNLDRPRLAPALGIEIPEELSLSGQVRRRKGGLGGPWGVVGLGPSLFVLAESGPGGASEGTLHSSLFEDAVAALRRHYDYVVIDGPPVLGSGDANVLEEVSDGVLIVARAGRTKGAALTGAATQLGDRRLVGVVLNDVGAPERRASAKKATRATWSWKAATRPSKDTSGESSRGAPSAPSKADDEAGRKAPRAEARTEKEVDVA